MSRYKDIEIEVLRGTLKAVVDELEEVQLELELTKERHKRLMRRASEKVLKYQRRLKG